MKEKLSWKLIVIILLVISTIFITINIYGSGFDGEYDCPHCRERFPYNTEEIRIGKEVVIDAYRIYRDSEDIYS